MLLAGVILAVNVALEFLLNGDELTFQACKIGNTKQCLKTIHYLKASCDKGGSQSCGTLGYIYENGLGVSVNIKLALKFYEKSCDLRNALGCVNLGAIYASIENYDEANGYFDRACEMRNADGCYNLGISYLYGYGVMQSEILSNMRFNDALELYMELCKKKNASACKSVANIYSDGIITDIDNEKSQYFLQKACEIDSAFYHEFSTTPQETN